MKINDKVTTVKGAGGLLKGGLEATVLKINGNNVFISIGNSCYHVKANELVKLY